MQRPLKFNNINIIVVCSIIIIFTQFIVCLDFSDDQYSKTNEVFLINTKTQAVLTCGIIVTDTTSQRISCETV